MEDIERRVRAMSVIKVFRSAAFADLAQAINRFGAMLQFEAEAVFGRELVTQALRQRICARRKTALGQILFLLFAGRRLAGMAGPFTPTDDGLMNAVCLRDIGQRLEDAGYTIDLTVRKRALVFTPPGKRVLVLAQHDGYTLAALRRLHRELVNGGAFDQIQVFTYLTPEGVEELTAFLYDPPRRSPPIDVRELAVFSLPRPTPHREATLPTGVI